MSQPARPQISIDPYFDGEGGAPAAPHTPPADLAGFQSVLVPQAGVVAGQGRHGDTAANVNSTHGYHDARTLTLDDGRPMTSGMRSGPMGLAGVVIPHAGMGGVPAGVRIHTPQALEVNVDPHLEGQRTRLLLGDLTPERIAQATIMAAEITPEPSTYEQLRLRGSAVLHGVAALARADGLHQQLPPPAPAEYTTPVNGHPNIPAEHLARLAGGGQTAADGARQPPRRVSPLRAFDQEPHTHSQGREMRPIDLSAAPPPREAPPGPPRAAVTFEIENFGIHRARYHDVVVGQGFVVLVHHDSPDYEMYEPPSGEDAPPMAIHVDGDDSVHLIHTTGIVYDYRGSRHCVLMVSRTVPMHQSGG